jgi:phytoene dehydrogenase-like protein
VLRDQGVSVLAGAQVTEMRLAGGGVAGQGGGGEDLAKRVVYLRDAQGQQEVRAACVCVCVWWWGGGGVDLSYLAALPALRLTRFIPPAPAPAPKRTLLALIQPPPPPLPQLWRA